MNIKSHSVVTGLGASIQPIASLRSSDRKWLGWNAMCTATNAERSCRSWRLEWCCRKVCFSALISSIAGTGNGKRPPLADSISMMSFYPYFGNYIAK